ncbi:hypothetical protein [Candidatus Poriferisodalis sp.]
MFIRAKNEHYGFDLCPGFLGLARNDERCRNGVQRRGGLSRAHRGR